jgi:hypothetical protein
MALPNTPTWDTDELCIWFEIPYKAHTILCRIDASCFRTSLGATSVSEGACRAALRAQWPRIHATALAHAEAGNLETRPSLTRRFVWLANKSFTPPRVNMVPTAA